MWLRRTKSTTPSLPPFSCSSFKDIQSLFEDEPNLLPPKSSSVFHRTLSSKPLLRALSNEVNVYQIQENTPKPPSSGNGVVSNVSNVLKRGLSEGDKFYIEDSDLLVNDDVYDVVKNRCIDEDLGVSVSGKVYDDLNEVGRIVPGAETRVVIFFTSLRVVRSTFEDCKYVRSILHSFPVAIDERDLFMDGRFMKELERIMGKDEKRCLTLPRVFIGGRYFGGAEEIRRLHEAGELKKYLEGLAPKGGGTCEVCLGHGFVLCVECNGSHKCYVEKGGFRACSVCNENGLVRCSSCSSAPL